MCFITVDAVELVEGEEGERVAANRPPHALKAGADDWGAGDAHVHLASAGVAEQAHNLARCGAAHERVVDDDHALPGNDAAHGRKLELNCEVADCLRRLDEAAAAVVPPDEALLELEPRRLREAERGVEPRVRHRDDDVRGRRRRLLSERAAVCAAALVDGVPEHDGVGEGEVDVLEDARLARAVRDEAGVGH
nr:unnamed protein product [Digitaria exilis]